MSRVNGHAPLRDEDFRPPHVPYVLLCHHCMRRTWTVNKRSQWVEAVKARRTHENLCIITPPSALILPGETD